MAGRALRLKLGAASVDQIGSRAGAGLGLLQGVVHSNVDTLFHGEGLRQFAHHVIFALAVAELFELLEQVQRVLVWADHGQARTCGPAAQAESLSLPRRIAAKLFSDS